MFSGERLIVAEPSPGVAVGVAGFAGGVESGGATGVTLTGSEGVDGLPDVSTATTRKSYDVPLTSVRPPAARW